MKISAAVRAVQPLRLPGVVIGTFLIVIMVSLGIAVNVGFDEMLQSMGDLRKITVYGWGVNGSEVQLNDDAVAQMSKLDHVLVATPYYQPRYLSFNLVAGKNDRYQTGYVELYGIYPEALEMMQYELKSGSYLRRRGPFHRETSPKFRSLSESSSDIILPIQRRRAKMPTAGRE